MPASVLKAEKPTAAVVTIIDCSKAVPAIDLTDAVATLAGASPHSIDLIDDADSIDLIDDDIDHVSETELENTEDEMTDSDDDVPIKATTVVRHTKLPCGKVHTHCHFIDYDDSPVSAIQITPVGRIALKPIPVNRIARTVSWKAETSIAKKLDFDTSSDDESTVSRVAKPSRISRLDSSSDECNSDDDSMMTDEDEEELDEWDEFGQMLYECGALPGDALMNNW